jgi:hypothetical protein
MFINQWRITTGSVMTMGMVIMVMMMRGDEL